jgi:hypothetical protein
MPFITICASGIVLNLFSGKFPIAQIPFGGATAFSPSVVSGLNASSLPVITADCSICSIGRILLKICCNIS